MTATILYIRDYHLKRVEKQAAELMGQLLDYAEIARDGGPIVDGATELPSNGFFSSLTPEQQRAALAYRGDEAIGDPWAGQFVPDGIDGLV